MPSDSQLLLRVKQALEWLKQNKGFLQKDIAEMMGMSPVSLSRGLDRIAHKYDENFVISFNEATGNIFSINWLLKGELPKFNDELANNRQNIDQSSMVNAIIAAKDETIDSYKLQLEQERRIQQLDIMRLESRIHDLEDKIAMQKEIIDSLRQQLGNPPKNTGQYPYGVAEKHNP